MKYQLPFLILMVSATLFAQTTVTFTPTKDNTIYEISNTVSNGAGVSVFSGKDNNGRRHRGLLQFNLSSIPANATITNVSLQMNVNKTRAGISDVHSLQKVSANWGEGTSSGTGGGGGGGAATANDATWSDRFFGVSTWSSLGGDFSGTMSSSVSIGSVGSYTFPNSMQLIADVQSWITTPANNFGWIIIGNESSNQTARAFDSRESSITANRPTLSVTYTATVPVELIDFQGIAKNNEVQLSWVTASENNSSHFDVEAKKPSITALTEGVDFQKIGTLKAAGTSSEKRYYSFSYTCPISGIYQYRLKQVDFDGKVHYSKVISISIEGKEKTNWTVYPNPATDKIFIEPIENVALFNIIDATGRIIRVVPTLSKVVDISDLSAGIYFVKAQKEGQVYVQKFLKK